MTCSCFIHQFCRVAVTPAVAATLIKKGYAVNVEDSAGLGAKFRNEDYSCVGAKVVDRNKAYGSGNELPSFQFCKLVMCLHVINLFQMTAHCRYNSQSATTPRIRNLSSERRINPHFLSLPSPKQTSC